MLSGTTSSRTVTRCALSAPAERDLRFLPVLLGWISPTPYSRFFSPARCISSSRPVGFFPSHSVIFLPTCSSSSLRRVLMSLRNGVDMSAVLVVTSSTFYLPSSFGGSVRNIGDNRTYFFFYRGIFIISSGPCPRGFIYPPPSTTFPLTRLSSVIFSTPLE